MDVHSQSGAMGPAKQTQEQFRSAEAMWRGFRMRCPNCRDRQTVLRASCRSPDHMSGLRRGELPIHRADDFPPYLVMIVVGQRSRPGPSSAVETVIATPIWLHAGWPADAVSARSRCCSPPRCVVALPWADGDATASSRRSCAAKPRARLRRRMGGRRQGRLRGLKPYLKRRHICNLLLICLRSPFSRRENTHKKKIDGNCSTREHHL